jgi:hypothetical protein
MLPHFHDFDIKKMIRPNISRRPRSISAVRTYLPASGIELKLLMEPTVPKPGPTFPMVAAEPLKAERQSTLREDNRTLEMKMMAR